jgi:adenylate cyclase
MTVDRAQALRGLRRALGGGRLLALGLLAGLLLLRYLDPAPIEILRLRVFDFYQRLAPRVETNWPAVIVDIDEASLKELGQWPWPRTIIAELVDRLAAAGAASVSFDVVFAEPDRTSPAELTRLLPGLPPDAAAALSDMPSNDEVLADSLRRYGRAVLGEAAFSSSERAPEAPRGRYPATIGVKGEDPDPYLFSYSAVLQNLDMLTAAAGGRGSISLAPDIDEVVRRVPVVIRVGDQRIPVLSLEALRVLSRSNYALVANEAGVVGIQFKLQDIVSVPTDTNGRVYLRFGPHDPRRYVSAADVIAGRLDPARLRGRIVLVGASVPGLRDLRATPITAAMPGVEIHAQLIESVLSKSYLSRPNYALGVEMTLVLGVGLLLIVLVPIIGARWTLALLLVLIGLLAAGSWLFFFRTWLLLDASYPVVSATLLYLFLAYTGFTIAERQRKEVSNAFEHYLSPVLVKRLLRDPAALQLGGESKVMTVLFADIRDFTTLSERFRDDPQGLTRIINRVLTGMGDAVLEHEGTIDKYIGDSLMAFWNAPLDIEHHAAKACAAALVMLNAVEQLNAELRSEQGENAAQVRIGVGFNTGQCVVGNLGSIHRFDYSVLGDPVNLAARLEGQSKTYGIPIVLSEDSRHQAEEFATLELDLIAVKGRKTATRVYGLLGGPEQAATDRHRALTARQARLLAAYRAQSWDEAEAAIAEGLAATPELARLYELYRRRIAVYRAEPPGPGWDGVFVATEK